MSSTSGYSPWQIRLPWLAAVLIVLQVVLHEPIAAAWKALQDGASPAFDPVVAGHVAGGIAIFLFTLWRLVLRARRGAPAAPDADPAAIRLAAMATHVALYALMLLMPISGALAWFGGVVTAAAVHAAMVPALIALVGLHVLAVLWHQFGRRDGVLRRMLRPAR